MKVVIRAIQLMVVSLFLSYSVYGAKPINLRVVWTESPQTKAVVAWDSVGAGEGVLHVREASKKSASSKKGRPANVGVFPKPKENEVSHCYTVPLEDLKPSTRYRLVAQIGNEKTTEHYFITAPNRDVDFKIFFVGDSRSNLKNARAVSQLIKKTFEEDSSYIGLLHGGDFANRASTKDWNPWLAAYSMTTAKDGRLLPIIPVRGNHEGGKSGIFDLAYGSPGQEVKNYYTCMLSPQVAIVVLNSMYSVEGDQKEFLEKELANLKKKKVRFQMAAYHIPLYPAIKKPHRGKRAWVPLFEKYNIDLGLESDGHCIKRTVPIRGDKKADDGIVYLGEGGYGAPQRSYKGGRWYLDKPGFVSKGEHFMALSFTKKRINYFTSQLGKGKVDSTTFSARKR